MIFFGLNEDDGITGIDPAVTGGAVASPRWLRCLASSLFKDTSSTSVSIQGQWQWLVATARTRTVARRWEWQRWWQEDDIDDEETTMADSDTDSEASAPPTTPSDPMLLCWIMRMDSVVNTHRSTIIWCLRIQHHPTLIQNRRRLWRWRLRPQTIDPSPWDSFNVWQ